MKPLTNIFKKKRLELGITVEEACEKLDMSVATLSFIENDKRNCSTQTLIKLCDFYKIPYNEALDFMKEQYKE